MRKTILTVVVIILILLTLKIALAYDEEKHFYYNESDLPLSSSYQDKLQIEANNTAYFNIIKSNSNATIEVPQPIYFNTTKYQNFSIDFSIIDLAITKNYTIETAIRINTTNDITYELGLFFHIIADEWLVQEIDLYLFYLIDSGYALNITTNLLPTTGSKEFRLNGYTNLTVNITNCGEWLTCPDNFTFITNESILYINYSIPINTSPGNYERTFELNSVNVTRTGKFEFHISDPSLILQEYVWRDECFESEDKLLTCIREKEEFDKQRLSDIYSLALSKFRNGTETVYNTTEILVMAGSIDDELKILYDSCVEEKNNNNDNLDNCNNKLSSCINEKDDVNSEMRGVRGEVDAELESAKTEAEKLKADATSSLRWWRNFIIIIIISSSLIGFYVYRVKKANGWW